MIVIVNRSVAWTNKMSLAIAGPSLHRAVNPSYLRTGRADLFRLAEAHTRNTSETDTYHLGPMRGLGSRHNVVKWGDGAKEAHISQAAHWRAFFYLTTDERTGDLMRESAEWSGVSIGNFDPMREAAPAAPGEPKVRTRIGPDW